MITIRQLSNNSQDKRAIESIFLNQKDARIQFFIHMGVEKQIVVDFMLEYYFRFARQYFWVAEDEEGILGYLCGGLNPMHHFIMKHLCVTPILLVQMVRTGSLSRIKLKRLFAAIPNTNPRNVLQMYQFFKDYPAHLHINLIERAVGRRTGSLLMDKLLLELKQNQIRGVYASVQKNNDVARYFFEKHGFTNLDETPSEMPKRKIQRMFMNNIYVKKIT